MSLSAETTRRPAAERLHTLYISPLKALAVDIARNLERPVAEMGLPVLVETRIGEGRVLLAGFSAMTDWSNLPGKAEFVPMLLRGVADLRRPVRLSGDLDVRSDERDGTTVTVRIPLLENGGRPAPVRRSAGTAGSAVDREGGALRAVRRAARQHGRRGQRARSPDRPAEPLDRLCLHGVRPAVHPPGRPVPHRARPGLP